MRSRKGTVGIESDRGWLRLRLPPGFSPRHKYLNLKDTRTNRQHAAQLARQLEAEIVLTQQPTPVFH